MEKITTVLVILGLLALGVFLIFYLFLNVILSEKRVIRKLEKIIADKEETNNNHLPRAVFFRLLINSFVPTLGDTIAFLITIVVSIPFIMWDLGWGLLFWIGFMVSVIYARFSTTVKLGRTSGKGAIFLGDPIKTRYDLVFYEKPRMISATKLFHGGVLTYFFLGLVFVVLISR